MTTEYRGTLHGGGMGNQLIEKVVDGKPRPLRVEPSQKVWNHSTGFNWGYGGSGPAQTALALLLDVTGNASLAQRLHQRFKFEVVAGFGDSFSIPDSDIRGWIERKAAENDES